MQVHAHVVLEWDGRASALWTKRAASTTGVPCATRLALDAAQHIAEAQKTLIWAPAIGQRAPAFERSRHSESLPEKWGSR